MVPPPPGRLARFRSAVPALGSKKGGSSLHFRAQKAQKMGSSLHFRQWSSIARGFKFAFPGKGSSAPGGPSAQGGGGYPFRVLASAYSLDKWTQRRQAKVGAGGDRPDEPPPLASVGWSRGGDRVGEGWSRGGTGRRGLEQGGTG